MESMDAITPKILFENQLRMQGHSSNWASWQLQELCKMQWLHKTHCAKLDNTHNAFTL